MEQQPEQLPSGTFLSLFLTLLGAGGFMAFLILVSGGFFFYVGLAVLAVGSVGFLHYLLWGQALTDETAQERADAQERDRAETETPGRGEHRIRRL
jgi:hypothetical protein